MPIHEAAGRRYYQPVNAYLQPAPIPGLLFISKLPELILERSEVFWGICSVTEQNNSLQKQRLQEVAYLALRN
jgi:hypothetical protein